jgi:hypothetical protein
MPKNNWINTEFSRGKQRVYERRREPSNRPPGFTGLPLPALTSGVQAMTKSGTHPKRLPLKDLVENPSAHFDSPAAVVTAPDLSDTDKKRVLDAWEEDARRLTVATEEGMSGGEPSRMDEVADAKTELGVGDRRRPSPTKAG